MKTVLSLGLAAGLATGAAGAQTIDRQAALDAVVNTERAFSQMSVEKGTRDAFLHFFADEAIALQPDPVPAKEGIRRRPANPSYLAWYPVKAEVSLAGDLGFSTGPYELRPKGKDDPQVLHGYFTSAWGLQPDGTYRVLIDVGTQSSKPAAPVPAAIAPAQPAKIEASALPKVDAQAALDSLLAADRAFGQAAQKGDAAAWLAVLADDGRLHRVGFQPYVGKEAIQAVLAKNLTPETWQPAGGKVARSGDLGFTYGKVQRRQSGPESPWVDVDTYVHYWRRQPGGPWKLVLDVTNPIPPKPPVERPRNPEGGG